MAKKHESRLVALSVIVSQVGYAYSSGKLGLSSQSAINELLEKSKQETNSWLSQIGTIASAQGVPFRTEIVASPTSVVPAVVEYAEKNHFDLIVVGTRGRSGLTKLLLGSVASGVVAQARCPVLIVK
jgi:nucleotide-binding universal stress UspA family protein